MKFIKVEKEDKNSIDMLSKLATAIIREHFDPIIVKQQNDYMIDRFQTVEAIAKQLEQGYQYYFCLLNEQTAGFFAFYRKKEEMYLSKFYLKKEFRGKGFSKEMLRVVIDKTKEQKISKIRLNVNRNNSAVKAYEQLGFYISGEEKNDIGCGYVMDDYVMTYEVEQSCTAG